MKKSNPSKILSVQIEFEDRTISLEGQDAETWENAINSQSLLSSIHGAKFPELNWKVIYKNEQKI